MNKELVKLPMVDIHPYDKNPRKNDNAVDDVAESIRQTGYIASIVVDENNEILAGHTRYKALKKLGYEEIDVMQVTGLTEEQKKKYRLLDNKVSENATWDFDLLQWELEDLNFEGYDFGFTFPYEEEQIDVTEDDYDAEIHDEPITKRGQIWQLGRHRLMCGDSTNADDVALLMGGAKGGHCILFTSVWSRQQRKAS